MVAPRTQPRNNPLGLDLNKRIMATASGFEPPISTVTGCWLAYQPVRLVACSPLSESGRARNVPPDLPAFHLVSARPEPTLNPIANPRARPERHAGPAFCRLLPADRTDLVGAIPSRCLPVCPVRSRLAPIGPGSSRQVPHANAYGSRNRISKSIPYPPSSA